MTRASSFFGDHVEPHLADALDRALEAIAWREPGDAGGGAGRDEVAGTQGAHAREKADVLAHAADHVAGMRGHDMLAVQLDVDAHILRLGQLVARHDPGAERGKGVEALADVARVLTVASPG